MKHLKFFALTVCLAATCIPCMTVGLTVALFSDVCKFLGFKTLHHYSHFIWINLFKLVLDAFDFSDAVIGNRMLDFWKQEVPEHTYSVHYLNKDGTSRHISVCAAHCPICAVYEGYDNSAAGYHSVDVEVIS